jgi:hypothetical protein
MDARSALARAGSPDPAGPPPPATAPAGGGGSPPLRHKHDYEDKAMTSPPSTLDPVAAGPRPGSTGAEGPASPTRVPPPTPPTPAPPPTPPDQTEMPPAEEVDEEEDEEPAEEELVDTEAQPAP